MLTLKYNNLINLIDVSLGMNKIMLYSLQQTAYVAWVNTTVFDYEGKLQINKLSLYAWPIDSELEDSVHYMGSTVLNPGTNECLCVEIEIIPPKIPSNYPEGIPITYPSNDEIMGLAKEIGGVTIPAVSFVYYICKSVMP